MNRGLLTLGGVLIDKKIRVPGQRCDCDVMLELQSPFPVVGIQVNTKPSRVSAKLVSVRSELFRKNDFKRCWRRRPEGVAFYLRNRYFVHTNQVLWSASRHLRWRRTFGAGILFPAGMQTCYVRLFKCGCSADSVACCLGEGSSSITSTGTSRDIRLRVRRQQSYKRLD